MSARSGTQRIPGAPDAEPGTPRAGPPTFHRTRPDGAPRGSVFVIHGFGLDAQPDYRTRHVPEPHLAVSTPGVRPPYSSRCLRRTSSCDDFPGSPKGLGPVLFAGNSKVFPSLEHW